MYQGDVPEPADHDDGAEHAGGAHRGDRVRDHHQAAAPAPGLAAVIHNTRGDALLNFVQSSYIYPINHIHALIKVSQIYLFALLFQYRLKYFNLLIAH